MTVFALDITNADYHTLEVGLEQVAEDTGGFYAKTHLFAGPGPGAAGARPVRALRAHVRAAAAAARASTTIDIRLVGKKGTVLARRSYEG